MVMKEISLDQTSQLFGTKSNPVLPQQITIKDGNLTSNFEYLSLATLCSLKNPKIIFMHHCIFYNYDNQFCNSRDFFLGNNWNT